MLSVRNEGKEIPADQLPSLFLPFHQVSVEKKREGLGLGLYIASEIAAAHGGKLSVTSAHNQTEFTFRMPVIRCPAQQGGQARLNLPNLERRDGASVFAASQDSRSCHFLQRPFQPGRVQQDLRQDQQEHL